MLSNIKLGLVVFVIIVLLECSLPNSYFGCDAWKTIEYSRCVCKVFWYCMRWKMTEDFLVQKTRSVEGDRFW